MNQIDKKNNLLLMNWILSIFVRFCQLQTNENKQTNNLT